MRKSIFDNICEAKGLKNGETISSGEDVYVNGKGAIVKDDPDKQAGLDRDDNDSEGLWEVEAPTDDDLAEDLDMSNASQNKKDLVLKMKTKRPFFIQGRAGWGKTTLITQIAKKFGRSVITVYLDKAEAVDLGGIPVPVKDEKTGEVHVRNAMPGWAAIIAKHPERKYLLFFDELNHCASDVMKVLMPIVLKGTLCGKSYPNFIVGAAGNTVDEGEFEELPPALVSRMKPIIQWETNTESTWNEAFKFIHKQWDSKVGEDLVNMVHQCCFLFENPREVEGNILQYCYELVQEGDNDWMSINDVKRQLDGLLAEERDGVKRYDKQKIDELEGKLASYVFTYIQSGGKGASAKPQGRMSKKDDLKSKQNGTIDADLLNDIKDFLVQGYVRDNDKKYGISLENIGKVVVNADETPITAAQITWLKNNLKTLGIKPRFETNDQFKKEGYAEEGE